ncbi:MAG TPA: DedA family protein, partial [Pseudolabrys sp.]|nr:DedA family protein [Pseudolabrys sp.]
MTAFNHILGAMAPWLHAYGSIAVFVILTFESLGLPLPGESLLVVASILAGRGELSFPALLLAAWCGAVLGDNIGYVIGKALGRPLLRRYGQKVGISHEKLQKVEAVFARYGAVAVGFARFVNILRQLNGVVAGALEMHWLKFLIFNALGGAAWVAAWTTAGYYIGKNDTEIEKLVHKLGIYGVVI